MTGSKQIYIDFILDQLANGNILYNSVSSLFCSNFRVTNRTFDKYWKLANEAYSQQRQAVNSAKMEISIQTELEAHTDAILTKNQALQVLSIMVVSESTKDTDKIKAIETMSKMEGWMAATTTIVNTPLISPNLRVEFLDD
jgi:hypothetical protein